MSNEKEIATKVPTLDEVLERIAVLYDGDASKIAKSLGDNPLCVVTGPRGSGKTHYLIPRTERALSAQGLESRVVDFHSLHPPEGAASRLDVRIPKVKKGVLILDEAGEVGNIEVAKEILELSHKRGYSVIPVTAGLRKKDRERLSKLWTDAEEELSGFQAEVQSHGQKRLDDDLASDLLRATAYSSEPMPREVSSFIISVVPNYIRILWQLRNCETVEKARRSISNQYDSWLRNGTISREEWDEIEQNLHSS